MKKIVRGLCTLLLMCSSFNTQAQLADNTIAPDFTLTDINGNVHNLYSILDEGKSVILDFSATWCGPCWQYHNAGVLEQIYEEKGPEGTDELMVFYIESDISTDGDDLAGPTASSQGNWIAGTTYPIIDLQNQTVTNAYDINYFPTIYFVGPNRLIKETAQAPVSVFESLIESALPPASGQNNLAIASYTGETFYCEALDASLSFQNLGLANLTSATFLAKNPAGEIVATKNWTGNLAPYALGTVTFDPIEVNGDILDLTFEATLPNGVADEDPTANTGSVLVERERAFTEEVTITVKTDDYGYETYWALLDEAGEIVADGGNPAVGLNGGGLQQVGTNGGYSNNTEYTETVAIDMMACYKFVVVDDYGDGFCCFYGEGFYEITAKDGTVILQGAEFETVEEKGFRNAPAPVMAAFATTVENMTVAVTNQSSDNAKSYLWNFGDGKPEAYSQAMTPAPYTYTEAGVYTVSLTVADDYSEDVYTQEVTVSFPTSVNNIQGLSAIKVFPVPATNNVTVAFDMQNNKTLSVSVVNAIGQTIQQFEQNANSGANQITIDTNNFANGIYFINFETQGQVSAQRFTVLK